MSGVRRAAVYTLASAVLSAAAAPAFSHDIQPSVVVHAYVAPENQRLFVLLRVPLSAMRDVDYPRGARGEMDLGHAEGPLRNAVRQWLLPSLEAFEGDDRLAEPSIAAVRASLPSDMSFTSYDEARAHLAAPPPSPAGLVFWDQTMLNVQLEYGIRSDRSRFSLRPEFSRLGARVATVLRFRPPGGAERAFELQGDPGLVRLDPTWHQAALQFVRLGFRHVLEGADHLLFLFCLVVPLRRLRPLVLVVTSFTVAHSITLIASALSVGPSGRYFPPLVETLIAATIVYTALENIVRPSPGRRTLITFAFGLVHGFGFSFALRESLQFAGAHLVSSLLAFNVGIELGQILVLAVLVPALHALVRRSVERPLVVVFSAIAAHTGWHWLGDRFNALRQHGWPRLEAADLLAAVRVLLVLAIAAGVLWLVRHRSATPSASVEEAGR